ncbi:MAG: C4-type zinc ribbon domain-containing protein [bacterium]|nr:C4-type zinc ribbon domain-containing protein [bacterium]
MNIILSKLIDLQKMDTEILNLKKDSLKIPLDINNDLTVFHAKEKQLLDTKNLISELQKLKRDQEREIETKDTEITKLNSQLSQISTNKEYSTLIFEIENKKKEKVKIEETELEVMYKIETQEKNIKNEEKIFSEEKNKMDKEKKIKEEALNKINNVIEEKIQQRTVLMKDIPKEILFKYEQILRSKEGIAVAKINFTREVCLGCHMSLPPQLINEVKPNKKLLNCDKCGRFLYWEDETHG